MPADYLPMRKHWNSSTPDLTLLIARQDDTGNLQGMARVASLNLGSK